ncbi:ER degradation-enhancing alpha-mannosidase-like protein 1 [Cyphellophora attinorum]|uniref:alpha-1,2-Mannosidase n=1 Tax=Cyphellophora attinorum TaxID=1664694 RepID=A0A0N1HVN4_9EURO|nr:ER degradation-enhancing alpha-mannosidase-like protein 1 [Phialophora attinorum]KPI43927.1 ER degradation-enhancing alpha-mannosidase-like protein 1 [Phialophora attinorum]
MRKPQGPSSRPHVSLTTSAARNWLVLVLSLLTVFTRALSPSEVAGLRKETEDLFYHGYENYMAHGFPEDEVRPLTCRPLARDRENPGHFEINDALGNYSLTLIDSLSTLAVLASSPSNTKRNKPLLLFQDGIQRLVEQYGDGTDGARGSGIRAKGFDVDSKVQVFETAIRGLGGLLSAHLFAVGDLPIRGYAPAASQADHARTWHSIRSSPGPGIKWKNGFTYNGQLLRLAHDLGSRLLPAFWTETGIPYPRVNLRSGIPFYAKSPRNFNPVDGQCGVTQQSGSPEVTETCSAGAGSLVVEFSLLSRLTGDPRFEELAKRAFWAVWNRRSAVGLVGAGIDAETGDWLSPWTGIGAGIDSFYEYAFKSYVLLSRDGRPQSIEVDRGHDPRMLFDELSADEDSADSFRQAWVESQGAIKRHIYRGSNFQHPHYIQVDLNTGASRGFWIDALSAFYPGVLAQAGHIDEAVETHLLQTALWTRFSALPERWSLISGGVEGGLGWWVGRPEFIESNYHIYRATEDPWYLYVAEMTLRDIKRRCWARCGWTSIQNVLTGEQTDRMESFFLGETAKYLFLTFDPDHPLNHLDEPFVFSTEGHPLVIPRYIGEDAKAAPARPTLEPEVCPPKPASLPFSISWTAARRDVYHAASLARLHMMPIRDNIESALGEYATDHPSINIADLSSPSNYTYYPWTLPPAMVPHNAMTGLMPTKATFDITFPTISNEAAKPSPPLQRLNEGILINHIGGLKLGMIQDVPDLDGEAYRIQAINNLALGKDEKVYLSRETDAGVLSLQDPYFTRIRDRVMLDLVVDAPQSAAANSSSTVAPFAIEIANVIDTADAAARSAWNAIFGQLASLIKDNAFPLAMPVSTHQATANLAKSTVLSSSGQKGRHLVPAITATGLGAAAIPDWPDSHPDPRIVSPVQQTSDLPWTTFYTPPEDNADLCNYRLPSIVPRTHKVIVAKRGGCSFSEKLRNIPAFPPSSSSLQLVVIVSYGVDQDAQATSSTSGNIDQDVLVRPLLDEAQLTPTGLARQNGGIPMVMVGGGADTWERLKKAQGMGIRRRWEVQCRGVRIDNLVIL